MFFIQISYLIMYICVLFLIFCSYNQNVFQLILIIKIIKCKNELNFFYNKNKRYF